MIWRFLIAASTQFLKVVCWVSPCWVEGLLSLNLSLDCLGCPRKFIIYLQIIVASIGQSCRILVTFWQLKLPIRTTAILPWQTRCLFRKRLLLQILVLLCDSHHLKINFRIGRNNLLLLLVKGRVQRSRSGASSILKLRNRAHSSSLTTRLFTIQVRSFEVWVLGWNYSRVGLSFIVSRLFEISCQTARIVQKCLLGIGLW